jgi:RimJ/RimL family protein N-acetyltransferase
MIINHHIQATLARDRQATLRAEAASARLARRARPRQVASGPAGTQAVLRDGSRVLIRPVQSTDAPLLADGFARLSATSRWMRFLTPKKELSPKELRYFTDLDHHDHEALGALDHDDGRGVGVARYVRQADDPYTADIAVTIVDEWQGRGLGTELLARLSDRAREENIRRFTALVAAENAAVAGLLRNAGASLVGRESSTLEYEISLATQVRDAIACLDVLAAQMRTRGWTAYLATPPGRLASLVVQDPHDGTEGCDIIAAPGGSAGDLWYWFSWGERIASARRRGGCVHRGPVCRTLRGENGMIPIAFSRSGQGAPLVLLHGLGLSRQSWDPVIPALAGQFDVIAVDLPGFGGSDPPPRRSSRCPLSWPRPCPGCSTRSALASRTWPGIRSAAG